MPWCTASSVRKVWKRARSARSGVTRQGPSKSSRSASLGIGGGQQAARLAARVGQRREHGVMAVDPVGAGPGAGAGARRGRGVVDRRGGGLGLVARRACPWGAPGRHRRGGRGGYRRGRLRGLSPRGARAFATGVAGGAGPVGSGRCGRHRRAPRGVPRHAGYGARRRPGTPRCVRTGGAGESSRAARGLSSRGPPGSGR